jgi:type VI secretion system secreted protein VgrG
MRVKIYTPLGKDVLLLRGFQGTEEISDLFQFELDIYSENRSIPLASIVGKRATLEFPVAGSPSTYLNGIFSSFSQGGTELVETPNGSVTLAIYRGTMVPWLWFLTCTADCRIFQNKKVPEIIQQIFDDLGFKDYKLQLSGDFHPREYCVQYRESSFNFISRLMEEEGIFYFFEHEKEKHYLVLADNPGAFKTCQACPTAYYHRLEAGAQTDELVKEFYVRQMVRPGQYALRDFNFETPTSTPQLEVQLSGKDERHLEIYDYPGKYAQHGEGDRLVRIRLEEGETPLYEATGGGNCLGFVSGSRFDLKDHYRRDLNRGYTLVSLSHQFDQTNSFRSSADTGSFSFEYKNQFRCIAAQIPFRPARKTPIPFVRGTQTAIVVGPDGEEIHVDKYGRVKVQFHWDREGKYNEDSSCWIRVAQNWAGKQWGMIMLPRIGQEVIVDFLEGNPDRPIITGRVYNAESMPPYNLPNEHTKSTIKSYSSKGGDGFNEIRFEDKKGDEQLFMHAEKDFDLHIKNDRREWIGNDRHLIVQQDRYSEVDRHEHFLTKGDRVEEIQTDHHLKIAGKEAIEITGSRSVKVTGDVAEKFSQNHSEEAGMNLYLKAGMNVVIEAGIGLTIKAGSNFLTINPMGIQMQGTLVMINSGGAALSGTAGNLVSPKAIKAALVADDAKPGSTEPTYKNQIAKRIAMNPLLAVISSSPSHNPNSPENKQKPHWIEIELVDEDGKPVPGEEYAITLPNGSVASGTLNEKGFVHIDGIDPGSCKVTFPNLDKDAWEPK